MTVMASRHRQLGTPMLQAIFPRSGAQERPFEPPITKKDSGQAEQFLDVGLMLGDVFGCFGCQDLLQLDAAFCRYSDQMHQQRVLFCPRSSLTWYELRLKRS